MASKTTTKTTKKTKTKKTPSQKNTSEVLVVGAGFAGLQTAQLLENAGITVRVLEARDRVGGRTLTQQVGGATLDLGGQWIGPTQDRLRRLSCELGMATFPTHHTGTKILDLDGEISTYKSDIPSISVANLVVLQSALLFLDYARKQVDPEDPCQIPRAAKWDNMSVEEFKQKVIPSEGIKGILDSAVRVVFGEEPETISLLHFLSYLNAGGGLLKLVEIKGGAQQERFVDGAQTIAIRMAEKLKGEVVLKAPVKSIHQSDDGVVVKAGRRTFRAKYVVMCVPVPLLSKIAFEPELPWEKTRLIEDMPMGQTIKCIATYERPFWRDNGFSGEVVISNGSLSVIFDNTSYDGKTAALLGFSVGAAGRDFSELSVDERKRQVLNTFANYFGSEALTPTDYAEKDWSAEEFSGGCPVANMKPGLWTTCGDSLRKPIGRLHFAGTETATEWTGYLEGALQSGERAASEVIERMFKVRRAKPFAVTTQRISPGVLSRDVLDAPSTVQAQMIRAGVISPVELMRGYIHRISEANPKLNAVVQDRFAQALREAEEAEATVSASSNPEELPPLLGVPCTIKEFFAVKGMPHTGALAKRKGTIAKEDCVVVQRLRKAGAIPMAITNAPEGGLWMETYNSITGRTNNPWNPLRTPGGSSGGEGALLAVGATSFGVGSDVGGSIRIPAAFC